MTKPKETLSQIIWSDSFTQNPYPAFQRFREHSPIEPMTMPNGQKAWMIFKYEIAIAALKEGRFIKDASKFINEEAREERSKQSVAYQNPFVSRHMLNVDPPDHHRLRSLVQKAFTPRMVANLQPKIEAIACDLLDQMKNKETIDLIDTFAFPLPIIVICDLLGIPFEDREQFRMWSNTFVEAVNDPERLQKISSALEDFSKYIDDFVDSKQHNLKDDLISHLIKAEENGDQLTKLEVRSLIFLLIIAGHETTVGLIGNGVFTLLQHPEQLDKLNKDQTLIDSAIEEMLRYEGPVEFTSTRWAAEDLTFYGQPISKGELVLIALSSADHDPEHFQDPDTFDITRRYNQHLAFGKGIHHCLGAPLARLEGKIAILALFKRYPHLQLIAETTTLQWRPGLLIRGLKQLPLKLN